jgi:hypothetical protein
VRKRRVLRCLGLTLVAALVSGGLSATPSSGVVHPAAAAPPVSEISALSTARPRILLRAHDIATVDRVWDTTAPRAVVPSAGVRCPWYCTYAAYGIGAVPRAA